MEFLDESGPVAEWADRRVEEALREAAEGGDDGLFGRKLFQDILQLQLMVHESVEGVRAELGAAAQALPEAVRVGRSAAADAAVLDDSVRALGASAGAVGLSESEGLKELRALDRVARRAAASSAIVETLRLFGDSCRRAESYLSELERSMGVGGDDGAPGGGDLGAAVLRSGLALGLLRFQSDAMGRDVGGRVEGVEELVGRGLEVFARLARGGEIRLAAAGVSKLALFEEGMKRGKELGELMWTGDVDEALEAARSIVKERFLCEKGVEEKEEEALMGFRKGLIWTIFCDAVAEFSIETGPPRDLGDGEVWTVGVKPVIREEEDEEEEDDEGARLLGRVHARASEVLRVDEGVLRAVQRRGGKVEEGVWWIGWLRQWVRGIFFGGRRYFEGGDEVFEGANSHKKTIASPSKLPQKLWPRMAQEVVEMVELAILVSGRLTMEAGAFVDRARTELEGASVRVAALKSLQLVDEIIRHCGGLGLPALGRTLDTILSRQAAKFRSKLSSIASKKPTTMSSGGAATTSKKSTSISSGGAATTSKKQSSSSSNIDEADWMSEESSSDHLHPLRLALEAVCDAKALSLSLQKLSTTISHQATLLTSSSPSIAAKRTSLLLSGASTSMSSGAVGPYAHLQGVFTSMQDLHDAASEHLSTDPIFALLHLLTTTSTPSLALFTNPTLHTFLTSSKHSLEDSSSPPSKYPEGVPSSSSSSSPPSKYLEGVSSSSSSSPPSKYFEGVPSSSSSPPSKYVEGVSSSSPQQPSPLDGAIAAVRASPSVRADMTSVRDDDCLSIARASTDRLLHDAHAVLTDVINGLFQDPRPETISATILECGRVLAPLAQDETPFQWDERLGVLLDGEMLSSIGMEKWNDVAAVWGWQGSWEHGERELKAMQRLQEAEKDDKCGKAISTLVLAAIARVACAMFLASAIEKRHPDVSEQAVKLHSLLATLGMAASDPVLATIAEQKLNEANAAVLRKLRTIQSQ